MIKWGQALTGSAVYSSRGGATGGGATAISIVALKSSQFSIEIKKEQVGGGASEGLMQ